MSAISLTTYGNCRGRHRRSARTPAPDQTWKDIAVAAEDARHALVARAPRQQSAATAGQIAWNHLVQGRFLLKEHSRTYIGAGGSPLGRLRRRLTTRRCLKAFDEALVYAGSARDGHDLPSLPLLFQFTGQLPEIERNLSDRTVLAFP
ncbi:hypothetical protein [Streptomyces nanshensis]|uniref:Uncharacterized protein n=1 Tax=Streptomyces nanshensis TaxID=518642 RepID=A0A1E7KZN5_9ACTN|nr:hypothetical protein [Streptomyces nanshensis]OEV09263.1 hypothetical protein AN218_22675 [Streptomyces nanshensis]